MDYDVDRYAETWRFNPDWANDNAQIENGAGLRPLYAGMLRAAQENALPCAVMVRAV